MTKWVYTGILLAMAAVAAESLPRFEGQSLSGNAVTLPDAAKGRAALLILGFSRGSQAQTKAWGQRVETAFRANPKVVIYSNAVLEDVPRLVRGMVARGIKSGIPAGQQDRFLLVYQHEQELKRAVRFKRPDDAYLVLLDGTGNILWRFAGAPADAALAELTALVQ